MEHYLCEARNISPRPRTCCLVWVALAVLTEDSLLPEALPETSSSKFEPFREIAQERIIGGSSASSGQFPWQVGLYLMEPHNTSSFCGGALISNKWVLTAAHCLKGLTGIQVVLGVTSLGTSGRTIIPATSSIRHEYYNPSTLAHDIALVELYNSAPTGGSTIKTIPLASSPLEAGVRVTVSGWGSTREIFSPLSETLKYVNLTTITNNACYKTFGNIIQSLLVCAKGATIQSACTGDSGGPLISGSGTNAVHVGIVSFGKPDGCAKGHPNVFTRTAAYRNWIRSKTGV